MYEGQRYEIGDTFNNNGCQDTCSCIEVGGYGAVNCLAIGCVQIDKRSEYVCSV